MNQENREFMIEISVSFNGEMPEHEGYYTSPDKAKETIDQLWEAFENNYD